MMPCPALDRLRLITADAPIGPETLAVEAHVEACPACQAELARLLDADARALGHLAADVAVSTRVGPDADFFHALKATPPPEVRAAFGGVETALLPALHTGEPAATAAPSLPRVPGFELLEELGRGGMGVVYKARQLKLNRLVALKMILSGAHTSAAVRDRFNLEAEAIARLQHPNIVQIYATGDHDGLPYLALELVEGGSLAERLRGKPQSARWAAELIETLARAVDASHRQGVVHRDLKPANILLAADGTPKITDFGLAKRPESGPAALTQSGQLLGTPSYMAPEQAATSGAAAAAGTDSAADVYSLGTILYETLTGRPPFRAETALETLLQVIHDDPVPPSRLQPKLPGDLETICLKCLRKAPSRRYDSALALAEDLRRFLASEPIQARPASLAERLWRWARRRPAAAALALGGAAALALGYVAVALLWRMAESRADLETRAHREAAARERVEHERASLERRSRETETRALRSAELRNASLLVDQALALCERGEVAEGMLRLAGELERLPAGAADLDRAIRMNLAAWNYRVFPHRLSLVHDGRVRALAYRGDGRVLATASEDGTARLWDVSTGAALGPPLRHKGGVRTVAFHPDGRAVLTGGDDGTARLWDASTGAPLAPPAQHGGPVRVVGFQPDGKRVLSGSDDGTVRIWDLAGRAVGAVMRHDAAVLAAAFRPDGKAVLTGSRDHSARLWDAATGAALGAPWTHAEAVEAVAFSPDGRRAATAGREGVAALWDPDAGPASRIELRHPYPVWTLAFSPDGRTLLTGSGLVPERVGEARLWDVVRGKPLGVVMPHDGWVGSVAWSPEGRHILTGGGDPRASLWLEAADRPVQKYFGRGGDVYDVAYGPDGRSLVIASYDTAAPPPHGEAWVHSVPPDQRVGPDLPHASRIMTVAISPDGLTVATGGTDRRARLWDAAAGRLLGQPLVHDWSVSAAAFSPDGRTLATGADNCAMLWAAADGRPLGRAWDHPGDVKNVVFSPDGKTLLATGLFSAAVIWDINADSPTGITLEHDDMVVIGAFSPDGRTVVTGSWDNSARLWDAHTGRPRGPVLRHSRRVRAVAFHPDGRSILTGSADMTARLWDARTGLPLGSPLLHPGPVVQVAFSPDGRVVATVGADDSVRLWDLATGKAVGTSLLHRASAIAISPDGRALVTGGREGVARLWAVPSALPGDPGQVSLWTRIVTGSEVDPTGMLNRLDAQSVRGLRQQWERQGAVPPL